MVQKSFAHYRILEKIGAGGMGEIYRARDSKLGRDVALKVLPPELARDPEHRQRFEREAKAIAALKHPNIVTIYSVEEIAGLHIITMELVEGRTLAEIIPDGGLPLETFCKIAVPLAEALSCAHSNGVTHRDIKPTNIMLDEEGRPKILDFGLAKHCQSAPPDIETTLPVGEQITGLGQVMGTAAYMSPEQVTCGDIGGSSDIFSLGIVFHELLSGAKPFGGKYPIEVMNNIVTAEAPRLSSLPEALIAIIDRCLKKAPEDRYSSAEELRDALLELDLQTAEFSETGLGASSKDAQSAFDREDWDSAHRELISIRDHRDLRPDEQEMLATCLSWIGEADEYNQALEKAYAEFARSDMNADAARVALELVRVNIERNADSIAGGWKKRAERLLENEPDCIERGNLLRRQTVEALASNDYARALELNGVCGEIADRFQNTDLQAEALHDRGQILIAQGEVEEGTACVDEAMISAVTGEVNPATLGNLYCRTMVVCRSLSDFKRAREWSEAAWRWCEPSSKAGFRGICQIHSAETMRHLGLWEKAEEAIRCACKEFEGSGYRLHTAEAFNELGELALCKGDYREAEEAFQKAHAFGCDPVPGLPLLRLAQGKGEAAQQTIERALDENLEDRLRRAKLLVAAVTIALTNGNLAFAEASVEELKRIASDYDSQCFKAFGLMGQGAIELHRDDCKSATVTLLAAWSLFNELGHPYDAACARTLLGRAYFMGGNEEDAKLQLGAACETFRGLDAKPDLAKASKLMQDLS